MCILYTELVKSVLRVRLARIRVGRSRNFSTFFYFCRDRAAEISQLFFHFSVRQRWKFLDLFFISLCDEETDISRIFFLVHQRNENF